VRLVARPRQDEELGRVRPKPDRVFLPGQVDAIDQLVARDVFFSINRATQMPGVNSFDFTFQFYSSPDNATGDWYPDAADSQTGDFFRYAAGGWRRRSRP